MTGSLELRWEYIGTEHRIWKAHGAGVWSNIVLSISLIDRLQEEYIITANTRHIENRNCFGLENAKATAQNLLNSYILSQAIL